MEHKRIYTSNWNRYFKYIRHTNLQPFAICRTISSWVQEQLDPGEVDHHTFLAPSSKLVFGNKYGTGISTKEYSDRYIHELVHERRIDPESILCAYPDNSVFLCYEKPEEFCHRRVFAEWIEKETGFVIPEWKTPEEQEAEERINRQERLTNDLLEF